MLVSESKDRNNLKDVVFHYSGYSRAKGSFCKVAPSVYVSSPESCFCQMALDLSPVQLLLRGYELCGTFSVDALGGGKLLSGIGPRTSVSSLAEYIEAHYGLNGTKKAKKVLPFIRDYSASPMESRLVLLLCLPQSWGGYGLPWPELNSPVPVVDSALRGSNDFVAKRPLRCDLRWSDAGFALEYDSDAHHVGREKIAKDSIRRTRIGLGGVHVVSVTKPQVMGMASFDEVARLVARCLGVRQRARRKDVLERRFALRKELFEGLSEI